MGEGFLGLFVGKEVFFNSSECSYGNTVIVKDQCRGERLPFLYGNIFFFKV